MSATHVRSTVMISLAASAGVLGVTAMLSTAAAPAARADDFSDIINAINGDYTEASAAFSSALADFSSDNVSQGSAQLLDSFDDSLLGPTYNLAVGTVEVLEGDPVSSAIAFGLAAPTDFADGLTDAQITFASGASLFADSASLFGVGDYGAATSDLIIAADLTSITPLEEILLGTVASF